MSKETKIHLSKFETNLIENKEWILAKRSVTDKIYSFFGALHETYKAILLCEQFVLFNQLKNTSGKISKGENYNALPYIILDYPSLFSKNNVFAVRTLFWWANFFSISLHISGNYFQLKENFAKTFFYLKQNDFFICIHENEWQHHFQQDNFIAVNDLDESEFNRILKKDFFKISKKIELDKWEISDKFLEETFVQIIDFIKISFPGDEINL